jgi:monooxygenase
MLQRSPSYMLTIPERDASPTGCARGCPLRSAYALTRGKNVLLSMAFYKYCRRFPEHATRLSWWAPCTEAASRQVRRHQALHAPYKPWDQRVCLVPDGDLFEALRSGQGLGGHRPDRDLHREGHPPALRRRSSPPT